MPRKRQTKPTMPVHTVTQRKLKIWYQLRFPLAPAMEKICMAIIESLKRVRSEETGRSVHSISVHFAKPTKRV